MELHYNARHCGTLRHWSLQSSCFDTFIFSRGMRLCCVQPRYDSRMIPSPPRPGHIETQHEAKIQN